MATFMQMQLEVLSKASNELTRALFAINDKVAVGRHLSSPVLLQGEALSRHHFNFLLKEDGLEMEDLSSNGTWLNGKQLRKRVSARVKSGDVIEISGYRMEVILGVPGNSSGTRSAGKSAQTSTDSKNSWSRPLMGALHFFDPFELVLILLVISIFALITFYLTR